MTLSALAAPALVLLRAGRVFAPEPLGRQDVLIGGGRILRIAPDLSAVCQALPVDEVIDAPNGTLLPGLIDQHLHFLGGGEGDGARMPELTLGMIAAGGITTAAGLLGTDIRFKTLPMLLRRANELADAGLTTFIYTGSMELPPPAITSDIFSDIVLLDRVIGAKSAIAERLFPNTDANALAALAGQLGQARAISGKAAVLHLHVGRRADGLETVFHLTERLGLPPDQVVPTHVNRNPDRSPAFAQGLDHARAGGTIDLTCCLGPLDGLPAGMDVVVAVRAALDAGIATSRITLSSDAGVAVPDTDHPGRARQVPPSVLFRDLRRLVHEGGLRWDEVLPLATTNVARLLRLDARKGRIAQGLDADFLLLNEADCIDCVLSSGRIIHQSAC
jgi:beta-aspartyl-dipeptidase (metallo-type)